MYCEASKYYGADAFWLLHVHVRHQLRPVEMESWNMWNFVVQIFATMKKYSAEVDEMVEKKCADLLG